MSARNELRAKILGTKSSSKIVILPQSGVEIEVRQPTVGYTLDHMSDDMSIRNKSLRMVIDHCYVPNTQEKVFEETDLEVLMSLPIGGDYNVLIEAMNSMVDLDKAVKDASKNSSATLSGS